MKMTYKSLSAALVLVTVCGCGQNSSISSQSGSSDFHSSDSSSRLDDIIYDTDDPNYYDNVSYRAPFDAQNTNNFKEDFDGSMSDEIFLVLDGAWHNTDASAPHNGMKRRNLFYTTDEKGTTYLAVRGRGFYNRDGDFEANKPEGGCIITKDHLGPGRYEIDMAAMPREGGVTAMWTYCTTTGSEYTSQNEIDIEIGGSTHGTQYENFWATSWTTKTNKETNTVDVTDKLYLNDGQVHKYTFDWYTDYRGERRVDWFIDGRWINSIVGSMVPEHETPLWIGLWFPPLWAGNPAFEEDYLLIDNVEYTAFEADQYYESCRSEPGYTKTVPSQAGIQNLDFAVIENLNKISNGEFEAFSNDTRDGTYYGWSLETPASKGTIEQIDISGDKAFKLTSGSPESGAKYYGEYLMQKITNAYEGFIYDLSVDANLLNQTCEGNIEIYCLDKGGVSLSTKIIPVDSTSRKSYSHSIVMPEGSYALKIGVTAEKGSVIYHQADLIFRGRQ